MRLISITIYARPNTSDKTYSFFSDNTLKLINSTANNTNVNDVYQFISMDLNYSIQSSSITSTLVLSLNQVLDTDNILRSGQPIEITDNGKIVFQGVLLTLKYKLIPPSNNGQGGIYLIATLAPSIYQLTLLPVLFDSTQKQQIDTLLGIDTNTILLGNVAQNINTSTLLAYIQSNTDFNSFFSRSILNLDLPSQVFLMSPAGSSRDNVLRSSIDFTSTVFYQSEDGNWVIRYLDSAVKAPFSINIANDDANSDNVPAILDYEYNDNATLTPAVINNYNIITAGTGVGANVSSTLLSYKPNPVYFPRIQQLQSTGWFSGQLMHTPINNNIFSNPTTASLLNKIASFPNQYIISSPPSGGNVVNTAYQTLITAKEMAQSLTGYATLECLISLDDQFLDQNNLQIILGTCVDIANCDMKAGIIATYTRSYSLQGSYIHLSICPLGSMVAAWK